MELLAIYRGIKKCINTNTIPLKGKQKHNPMKRKRLYQTSEDDWKPKAYVFERKIIKQVKQ